MTMQGTAVYIQVTTALRQLALANPWNSDGMLPPEPALMERFQVSRGTLRRATEELVREGLLRPDRGRGTYISRQVQLRALMKGVLAEIAIPDSRWHLDTLRFVPDFVGSSEVHDLIREMKDYQAANTLFIAPDNSLNGLICQALDDGKRVVVPTYGMRRGMVLLDPTTVPEIHREFASTLDGLERFGHHLSLDALRELGSIDMLVTGAIAFTRGGVHVGSGDAFLDIEWGLLCELGLVQPDTSIVGVSHPAQIVDIELTPKALDITVDTLVTPEGVSSTGTTHHRPTGIVWSQLDDERLATISYLSELRPSLHDWTVPSL
ncbi:MAG TPA: 5-formyltetrahydrofolate cyclo-ligase [Glaciihabitans sp.]|jgi:5-formyltetrahydrofolate cyclo-ligase|nr:5-formyltetrahydrofolate cyclo-ligase [Glaciihabitans sp.]